MMLLSRIPHPRRTPLPECSTYHWTCVFCSRDLTESDFLQEMRLDRLCFYVLIEILSIHPGLLTFATLAQALSGRIYHYSTASLSVLRLSPLYW